MAASIGARLVKAGSKLWCRNDGRTGVWKAPTKERARLPTKRNKQTKKQQKKGKEKVNLRSQTKEWEQVDKKGKLKMIKVPRALWIKKSTTTQTKP